MSSFDQVQSLLNNAMTAENLRFKVYANNTANVDTPNFKRSNVVFESMIRRALEKKSGIELTLSHENHITTNKSVNIENLSPKVTLEHETSYRNDGNNVDIEKEANSFLKASLRYQAFSEIMNRNFKTVKYILTV